jgi:hypothetical protein
MGELAEVEHKIDTLVTGTFEEQISILGETRKNDCTKTISRAA